MIKEIKDEDLLNSDKVWNEKIGVSIKDLWEDEGIQSTYERRNEYQLEGKSCSFKLSLSGKSTHLF
jgi:hypothetical protein